MDKPGVTTSEEARRCAVVFRRASMAMCASSSREREEGIKRAAAVVQEVSSVSWRVHQNCGYAEAAALEAGGNAKVAALAAIDGLASEETGFIEILNQILCHHAENASSAAAIDETMAAWKEPASWSERHAAALLLVGVVVHFPRAGQFLLDSNVIETLCAIIGRAVRAATGADAAAHSESERARAAGTVMASVDAIVALSTLVSTGIAIRTEEIAGANLPQKLSRSFFELSSGDTDAHNEEHTSILRTLYAYIVGALCTIAEHAREVMDAHSGRIRSSGQDAVVNGDDHDDSGCSNSDVRLLKVFTRQVILVANESERNDTLASIFEEHAFGNIRDAHLKHAARETLTVETLE